MPLFDMVTGVSTGALRAPFALLGTPQDLQVGADLYRDAADKFAPTPYPRFWLRRTGGILDTRRFREAIAATFDAPMAERLRRADAENRQLLVATTDFDPGAGRVWDVAAAMGPNGAMSDAHMTSCGSRSSAMSGRKVPMGGTVPWCRPTSVRRGLGAIAVARADAAS